MVIHQENLDLVFGALSDATRRGLLAQLASGPTNISALAAPHNMSQPAISKHLRVLEKAGLILRIRKGREHFIRANPKTAKSATDWIAHYSKLWSAQFDAVQQILDQKE